MGDFQRLSIFDLDRTLIQGNASALFFRYLQQRSDFSLQRWASFLTCFLQNRYMSLNLSDLHSRIFDRHLRSRPKTLFTDHVDPFLQELLPRTWYIPTLLKLRLAQQLGHYTLILSNSPDFLVEPIAKSLGVDEWRATEYMTDEEGKFDKVGFVCHGAAKAETLRLLCHKLRINRQNTHVYTDSIHDLELLRIAGHPTVVNPDRQLRKISQAEGWQIL